MAAGVERQIMLVHLKLILCMALCMLVLPLSGQTRPVEFVLRLVRAIPAETACAWTKHDEHMLRAKGVAVRVLAKLRR